MPRFMIIMLLLPLLLPMLINAAQVEIHFSLYAGTDGPCSSGFNSNFVGLEPDYQVITYPTTGSNCVSYDSVEPALPSSFAATRGPFMEITCGFSNETSRPEIILHQFCSDWKCKEGCSTSYHDITSDEDIIGSCLAFASPYNADIKIQSPTTITDLCGKDYASAYSSYQDSISNVDDTDACSYESILAACKARRGAYGWTCSNETKTDVICKACNEEVVKLTGELSNCPKRRHMGSGSISNSNISFQHSRRRNR